MFSVECVAASFSSFSFFLLLTVNLLLPQPVLQLIHYPPVYSTSSPPSRSCSSSCSFKKQRNSDEPSLGAQSLLAHLVACLFWFVKCCHRLIVLSLAVFFFFFFLNVVASLVFPKKEISETPAVRLLRCWCKNANGSLVLTWR